MGTRLKAKAKDATNWLLFLSGGLVDFSFKEACFHFSKYVKIPFRRLVPYAALERVDPSPQCSFTQVLGCATEVGGKNSTQIREAAKKISYLNGRAIKRGGG